MRKNTSSPKGKCILPFALQQAAVGMSYVILSQLTYCLTNSYAISSLTVGAILLGSRIFDGITDLLAGLQIDRTRTRFGRARPYDLMAIPMWIFLVLCFTVPNWRSVGKVIWVILMYNLCNSICYTFVTIAQPVRIKRSFASDGQAKAISILVVASAIMSTVAGIICPILISIFEHQPYGWTIITSCFAVPASLLSLLGFFFVPELETDQEESAAVQPRMTLKGAVQDLIKNPAVFLIAGAVLMTSIITAVNGTAQNFYFTYIVGDIAMLSLVSVASLVSYFVMLLMPLITKRMGNRGAMMGAFALVALFNVLKLALPVNILWLAVCNAVATCGLTFNIGVRNLAMIDCMEYGKLKNGSSGEGVYSSVIGVADKVALGFGSFLVGLIMEIGGFDAQLASQSAASLRSIQISYIVLPAICAVLGIVIMLFYRVEKNLLALKKQKETAE